MGLVLRLKPNSVWGCCHGTEHASHSCLDDPHRMDEKEAHKRCGN